MKKLLLLLVGPVIAASAFASVDPTHPMVTGRGNIDARPGSVIVTNQTKPKADEKELVALEKFEVTGSLIRPAAKPAPKPKR